MAMSNFIINRVFLSSRHKLSLMSSLHPHLHYFPSTTPSLLINSNPNTPVGPTFTTPLCQLSRGFSKRRMSRNTQTYYDNEEDGGTIRAVDFRNAVKSVTLSQMEAELKALRHDLAKSSTGKACVGMADHIFIVTKGVKIPLNKMAAVSHWDPKNNPHILLVTPYDPHTIEELERAVVESPFGISLSVHHKQLHAYLHSLTGEQKQAVWKLVINSCERGKQSIRIVRRKALDTIKSSMAKKKEGEKTGLSIAGLSADDVKKLEKEVEELTKKYIESIEKIRNSKFKEIVEKIWSYSDQHILDCYACWTARYGTRE